ncbi:MAG TPA: hypothetical protein VIF57_10225 [Polyangia bacterium]
MHKVTAAMEAGERPGPDVIQGMGQGSPARKTTIVDGPFAESKELIAGYLIMKVDSIAATRPYTARFADVIGDVEMDVLPLYDDA